MSTVPAAGEALRSRCDDTELEARLRDVVIRGGDLRIAVRVAIDGLDPAELARVVALAVALLRRVHPAIARADDLVAELREYLKDGGGKSWNTRQTLAELEDVLAEALP